MPYSAPLGTPCWLDLSCTDPAAAAAFYEAVLGWRCEDKGPDFGHYRTCWVGQDEVAGIVGSEQEPSAWTPYLAVEDAEAALAAVEAAGGKRLSPVLPVGELGWMAFVQDPYGARVGLWQTGSFAGFSTTRSHGAFAWAEVNTRNGDELSALFVELFGLERDRASKWKYWTMSAGGRGRHGVLQMNEQWEGQEPHWMVYFAVDDLDAACQRVEQAGGKVCYPPFECPLGRIAIFDDPTGAAFSLVEASTLS